MDSARNRHRLRIVVPAFPAFNIYSRIARRTTALGPVCVATAVHEMAGWDAEVIDENNLGRYGPRAEDGGADHESLQRERPADVVGKRIMSRFYRFRYVLPVIASILSFPTLIFSLHRLGAGWSKWYRRWQTRLVRFGGWITIRKWTLDFEKGDFLLRLQKARSRMKDPQRRMA